jgi:hypothetical protein
MDSCNQHGNGIGTFDSTLACELARRMRRPESSYRRAKFSPDRLPYTATGCAGSKAQGRVITADGDRRCCGGLM